MLSTSPIALKETEKSYWIAVYLFPYSRIRKVSLSPSRNARKLSKDFWWLTYKPLLTRIQCMKSAMWASFVVGRILPMVYRKSASVMTCTTCCWLESVILSYSKGLFVDKLELHQPAIRLLHLFAAYVHASLTLYKHLEIFLLHTCPHLWMQVYKLYR